MAFSIADVKTDTEQTGDSYIIHGVGGVGKSSVAIELAKQNNGIFILGEEGATKLSEFNKNKIPHFPVVSSSKEEDGSYYFGWLKFKDMLKSLYLETHDYKSVIIDTIDSLVPVLDEYVVYNDFEGNHKKADTFKAKYSSYIREMGGILKMFDLLKAKKNMDIYILAHTVIEDYRSPDSEPWKRYNINLPGGAKTSLADLLFDWVDVCMFMTYDVKVDDKKGVGKSRIAYTDWDAAYQAKSRFDSLSGEIKIKDPIDFASIILNSK